MKVFFKNNISNLNEKIILQKQNVIKNEIGIFETMFAHKNKIFRLKEHLKRFFNSANYFHFNLEYSKNKICKIIENISSENDFENSKMRIILSQNFFLVECEKFKKTYANIVKIQFQQNSFCENSLRKHKMISYLNLKNTFRTIKSIEKIIYDDKNHILEGEFTNIFLVEKNKIVTPKTSCGILNGITKSVVKEICFENKIQFEEKIIHLNEIKNFQNIFLTNSLNGIIPIKKTCDIVEFLKKCYQKKLEKEIFCHTF